jgi:hypothetical protein
VTDEFHNKFSPQDYMLENDYFTLHGHHALGEVGAENNGISLSSNYDEEDVTNEISRDIDGDGDYDRDNLGDHHSGYIGIVRNGIVTSNGAMDTLVNDWQKIKKLIRIANTL